MCVLCFPFFFSKRNLNKKMPNLNQTKEKAKIISGGKNVSFKFFPVSEYDPISR